MNHHKPSLLSILDLTKSSLDALVTRGVELAANKNLPTTALAGMFIGQVFTKPSTRTRTSFFWAVSKMGGTGLHYDANALQLYNGESIKDTAMVLSNHLDMVVVRTDGPPEELELLRDNASSMAIINALCHREHPTQAIADLITIRSEFGSMQGRHVLYVGLPCNTMNSLVLACAMLQEAKVTVLCPKEVESDNWLLTNVQTLDSKGLVRFVHDWSEVNISADVIYTTRWESMGATPKLASWEQLRSYFAVSPQRIEQYLKPGGIFMHDLPATRDGEVHSSVLDGDSSRIRTQSFNKGIAAAVALERAANLSPAISI